MGKTISKLKLINIINNVHSNTISSIKIFPSESLISVSYDKSIKIWDKYFNKIQIIKNAHKTFINYGYIKDEDNFVTCSYDKKIKTWIRNKNKQKENKFKLNQTIENAHENIIHKVIYLINENLISCSEDKTLKIWEKNNNKYQLTTILTHLLSIKSILLLEDKNILLSCGNDGIKFWKKNNLECILYIKKCICINRNALKRIDNDRIIIGGINDSIIIIISLKKKKIIKTFKNGFQCYCICVIKEKGLFIISGIGSEIKIYRSDNYKCIQVIKDEDFEFCLGLTKINGNLIISYGKKNHIKVWSFIK